MIELSGVTRRYSTRVAVDNLSLRIEPGELFAFLGPNGAGKTTTIKMIVGLLQPNEGAVNLCGFDVVKNPREARLQVGYVPDEPHLYDKLTGRETLQFVAEMYGMTPQEAVPNIEEQIDTFELAEFVDRLAENYSHGMKQRVAFATALVHRPPILVVDEPMVGLDPRSARLVKDLLKRRAREGAAIFMSTHTLSVAEEIADRIGVITGARLQFVGTLDELRANLASQDSSLEDLYLEMAHGGDRDTQ